MSRRYCVKFEQNGTAISVIVAAEGPLAASLQVASLYPSAKRMRVSCGPDLGNVVRFLEEPEEQEVCA